MEKNLYYYIGSESQIGDLKLEKFGTEVKLASAEALNAIAGGAQLCPAADFNFTEQEVSLNLYPALRAQAPDAFHAKHKVALVAVAKHLDALQHNQSTEETAA